MEKYICSSCNREKEGKNIEWYDIFNHVNHGIKIDEELICVCKNCGAKICKDCWEQIIKTSVWLDLVASFIFAITICSKASSYGIGFGIFVCSLFLVLAKIAENFVVINNNTTFNKLLALFKKLGRDGSS